MPPHWYGTWNATYFRPSCPQNLQGIQKDIPDFPLTNISENCLYMNIFVPNVSTLFTWSILYMLFFIPLLPLVAKSL